MYEYYEYFLHVETTQFIILKSSPANHFEEDLDILVLIYRHKPEKVAIPHLPRHPK